MITGHLILWLHYDDVEGFLKRTFNIDLELLMATTYVYCPMGKSKRNQKDLRVSGK